MPTEQDSDTVSDTVAAITARLVARHDGLTVLRAVTDACVSVLSADATGVLVADPAAVEAGFRSVYTYPMRLMNRAVGGLNVFYSSSTDLPQSRRRFAQALADLAVLGLTQERDQRRIERLAEQTLTTLNDRAHVGHAQATGVA